MSRAPGDWRLRAVPLVVAALVVAGAMMVADAVVSPVRAYLPKTVRIGVNGSLPGWSHPRVKPTGFDVALAEHLAARYTFALELVPLAPQERERALGDGTVHLVIANFSIDGRSVDGSQRRVDVMDFAGPYFLDHSGIMYSQEKLQRFYRDNATSDKSGIPASHVCVSNGTSAIAYMKGMGVREDQEECFRRFGDAGDKEIVGVVTDQAILSAYTRQIYPSATAIPAFWKDDPDYPVSDERYGIALPDGSRHLCLELNAAIEEFLDGDHGPWQRAFDTHLTGVDHPERHKPAGTIDEGCEPTPTDDAA